MEAKSVTFEKWKSFIQRDIWAYNPSISFMKDEAIDEAVP